MNMWILLQVMINLLFFAGLLFLVINRKQSQKEDQKFSKGLQLLQNKISVLEDLSDQTDEQVRSLTQLLEAKYREIQGLLVDSDQQIQKMEEIAKNIWEQVESTSAVMGQQTSTEVQSMNKYVKAAHMANEGKTIEEVIQEVDITRGEAELIVAMNKDQLTFNKRTLPLWVQPEKAAAPQASTIGAEFLKALKFGGGGSAQESSQMQSMQMQLSQLQAAQAQTSAHLQTHQVATAARNPAAEKLNNSGTKPTSTTAGEKPEQPKVRPFEFRKIDLG